MWIGLKKVASAASLTASDMVGCGVAGAGEIFRRAAEFHQHRRLVDHLAGAEADDMHAEHAVGRLVGEDFHETVGVQHGAGAAVRREREFPDLVVDAGLLQLFLGLADRGDFGAGVDDARDDVVVHMAGLAGDDLGHRDALVLGLVREHRPGDHVADRIDARHIGSGDARRS